MRGKLFLGKLLGLVEGKSAFCHCPSRSVTHSQRDVFLLGKQLHERSNSEYRHMHWHRQWIWDHTQNSTCWESGNCFAFRLISLCSEYYVLNWHLREVKFWSKNVLFQRKQPGHFWVSFYPTELSEHSKSCASNCPHVHSPCALLQQATQLSLFVGANQSCWHLWSL